MKSETTNGGAEQYRLLLLIDRLQREGKTEAEITSAIHELTRERRDGSARR